MTPNPEPNWLDHDFESDPPQAPNPLTGDQKELARAVAVQIEQTAEWAWVKSQVKADRAAAHEAAQKRMQQAEEIREQQRQMRYGLDQRQDDDEFDEAFSGLDDGPDPYADEAQPGDFEEGYDPVAVQLPDQSPRSRGPY